MVGHVAPEAALGGPIAAIREGDKITIDARSRKLELEISDAEIARRMAEWKAPAAKYKTGVFAKYVALVRSAAEGAITTPAPPSHPAQGHSEKGHGEKGNPRT
jgi:dihydroxy-acid dehydratase